MNSALPVGWLAGLEVIIKIYSLLSIRRDKIARQELNFFYLPLLDILTEIN